MRSGQPLFTGISTYKDPQGRFSFRHPSDWTLEELADDRDGVIIRPEPADESTYFAIWIHAMQVGAIAEDLPEVRRGFDDGLATLPDLVVGSGAENTYDNIIRLERDVTFTESGQTRRRKIWGMYVDTWQMIIAFQGSSPEEFAYWLPMGNYCFATFELPEALWFATDRELHPEATAQ